jgi:hypothetical protein
VLSWHPHLWCQADERGREGERTKELEMTKEQAPPEWVDSAHKNHIVRVLINRGEAPKDQVHTLFLFK